jgi:hypothetical protein
MFTIIGKIIAYVVKKSVLDLRHWYVWFGMLKASSNNDMDQFLIWTEKWLQVVGRKNELLEEFSNI